MLRGDTKEINDVKQVSIIGKLHSMKWLKCSSQVSGHTKIVQDEKNSDVKVSDVKCEINEAVRPNIEVPSAGLFPDNLEDQQSVGPARKLNTDQSSSFVNRNIVSASNIAGLAQKTMETVWNEDINVPNTVFPNAQSLAVNRQDEKQMLNMAVAESVVTAHLEQFTFDDDEKKPAESSQGESDNWSSVCRNQSDSTVSDVVSQRNSKQCHDNNNNNAKSKTESEMRKGLQKAVPKVVNKKLWEQKPKKRIGTSSKELCPNAESSAKEKNDSINLNNNNNNTPESITELDKSSSQSTPEIIDKCNRVDSYNSRHLLTGRCSRNKEQELLKQQCKNKVVEEPEDKVKSTVIKSRSLKPEGDKRFNGSDDLKKCQKIQLARTQSCNVQYSRSKPLVKPQQRCVKPISKPDQECARQNLSGSNVATFHTSTDGRLKHMTTRASYPRIMSHRKSDQMNESTRTCKSEQNSVNREAHDAQNSENGTINKSPNKCFDTRQSTGNEQNLTIPHNSAMQNVTLRNPIVNAKPNNEKCLKGEQENTQRIKKDTNPFKRSSDFPETKYSNLKTNDQKTHNCFSDVNSRTQIESTKVTATSAKAVTSANKPNKTETSSSAKIAVQLTKFGDTCSNNAKTPTLITDGLAQKQDPCKIEKISSVNDVRSIVKTTQEENHNNSSNNRSNYTNVEMKSVKFAENVEEINSKDYSAMSYFNKPIQPSKLPMNSLLSEVHNVTHQMEHQCMQNKTSFENNAHYNSTPAMNLHSPEQDLQIMDAFQQKPNHIMHSTAQSIIPTGNIVMGNEMLQYQSMPTMYLNQYNSMHGTRKTPDSTNTVQTTHVSSGMTFNNGNQALLQNETTGVLIHNNQSSVAPPPGFRNHSMIQPDQWNLTIPDMFYFGNMMNTAPPMNLPVQNARPMCQSDFNNMQQLGYLQQPLFYLPQVCPQSWNSLLQYPTPLLQNAPYPTCATFPSQVIPSTNLAEAVGCHVSTSMQNNNPYRHLNQMQQTDNNPGNPGAMKYECYSGNLQGGMKLNSNKAKDSAFDPQAKAVQYHRLTVPNEYQNCSQDVQLMTPYSYPIALENVARNGQSNIQMQAQQKYQAQRNLSINYQRPSEVPSSYQGSHDYNNRKEQEMLKNETECVPPMVSPRDCMYYGINYSKKPEHVPNAIRSDGKPVAYSHSAASSYAIPQYQKNGNYQMQSRDIGSRPTIARGIRKTMEP